eukprot:7003521-Karenia_brevis.AAC.1
MDARGDVILKAAATRAASAAAAASALHNGADADQATSIAQSVQVAIEDLATASHAATVATSSSGSQLEEDDDEDAVADVADASAQTDFNSQDQ